ncbi:hypothetical protein BJX70DRAFT_396541 [Aspergillus crustosus]
MPTRRSRISGSRQADQKAPSSPSELPSHNTNSTTTTPYSQNFEQNLIDHQIYLPLHQDQENSDDDNEPDNISEIRGRLEARRQSLDPTTFSKAKFRQFSKAHWAATKEADVAASVFPLIEGDSTSRQQHITRNTRFTNFAALTDGTISQAQPDITYGARPEQIDREIRNQLGKYILSSANNSLPAAPNFMVEVKGPSGAFDVSVRQACHYGALGARAMDALHSYQPAHGQQSSQQQPNSELESQNNAYAVTATYSNGILNLYTSHLTIPAITDQEGSQRRPEYTMTPLRSFTLVNDIEGFCTGAAAYRNVRDWTGEKRTEAIAQANRKLAEARASRAKSSLDLVAEEEEEEEEEEEGRVEET